MVGWLADWLESCLTGWLAGWLIVKMFGPCDSFGSWTNGMDEMDIVIDPSTSESILSKYTAVGRWTISAASVERVEIICPVFGTYPHVIYNVTLQKTPKNEGSE